MPFALPFPDIDPVLVAVRLFGLDLAIRWYALAYIAGLLLGCGTFSLMGFPLDDVWHKLFGQDVTLFGPTHLMLIGGASLAGGRGSFIGTVLAALFLTMIGNILPLFQQPTEYAQMTVGALILVALILYQGPELLARLRTSWQGGGRLETGGGKGEAPAG